MFPGHHLWPEVTWCNRYPYNQLQASFEFLEYFSDLTYLSVLIDNLPLLISAVIYLTQRSGNSFLQGDDLLESLLQPFFDGVVTSRASGLGSQDGNATALQIRWLLVYRIEFVFEPFRAIRPRRRRAETGQPRFETTMMLRSP